MKHLLSGVVIFIFLILSFSNCRQKPKEGSAIIVKEILLDSIPSGSGIEWYNDSLFIVGDDAPALYQLLWKNHLYRSLPVSKQPAINNRIDRNHKPDYESAMLLNFRGGVYLFSFGSGSSTPYRDSMFIVNVNAFSLDTVVNVKRFYDHLRKVSSTDVKDWNLEAAAVVENNIVLFNRGNNMIFSFEAEAFVDYILSTGLPPPPVRYVRAKLPSIQEYEARLSGSSGMDDQLLFSASVEKTTDWKTDGPVLGSYIGVMNVKSAALSLTGLLTYPDGKASLDKVESVAYLRRAENGDIILAAIADNDDGKSKLMEIRLSEGSPH